MFSALSIAWMAAVVAAPPAPAVALVERADGLDVTVGGRPFAAYFTEHPQVQRPFFSHLFSPSGVRLTRNFPPVEGQDRTDHPAIHPGAWLAFGDLGGRDFWRNKGPRVVHDKSVGRPQGGPGEASFTVADRYKADGVVVGRATTVYRVLARPAGTLLVADWTFAAEREPVVFGDQDEMGFGVRLATGLTVAKGGKLTDAAGNVNEKAVRGRSGDWCDGRGTVDGKTAGVTLFADPGNFRKPWWHARDYGLIVANPFARKSLGKGEPSRLAVAPGKPLRLRFGLLVSDGTPDLAAAFADFTAQLGGH